MITSEKWMLVKVNIDIYAAYERVPPTYRIWTNGALYLEREFWVDWVTNYIEEELHLEVEPGEQEILIEIVRPLTRNAIWMERVAIQVGENLRLIGYEPNPQRKHLIKFTID